MCFKGSSGTEAGTEAGTGKPVKETGRAVYSVPLKKDRPGGMDGTVHPGDRQLSQSGGNRSICGSVSDSALFCIRQASAGA